MNIEKKELETILRLVTEKIAAHEKSARQADPFKARGPRGLFETPEEAVDAAKEAQLALFQGTMEDKKRITDTIRSHLLPHVEELSRLAVEETGMGNVHDKILKNKLAIEKTPSVEDLRSGVFTGDDGLTLLELSPFGVIGAITPSTNPSETIICNAIGMIAAGNAVVFSPHPGAYQVSRRTVTLIAEAITLAGGPENLVTMVNHPTLEKANRLMTLPKVNMLVATGGPQVVQSVLSSGKKAIGAGAGNPPVLVDRTADIEKAARDIVAGASFDNNLPCIAEKVGVIEEEIYDYLVFNMKKHGAFEIKDRRTMERIEKLLINERGHPAKDYIGKDARTILRDLGIDVGEEIRLILLETAEDHPFVQEELMMPVLPLVKVKDAEEGIAVACRVEHGFRHTAICHSKNIDVLTEMGHRIQTTIFVKNGPSFAGIGVGGEGYTTFTIAGPTGEGLTSASTFARRRRCTLVGGFAIR